MFFSCCAIALAGAATVGCVSKKTATTQAADARPATQASTRPIRAPRGVMEHDRVTFDAEQMKHGTFAHTSYENLRDGIVTDRGGISLLTPDEDFPYTGTWTSQTVKPAFAFTELLPSWNVRVPTQPETGARFDVRVQDAASATWSPWLYMGYWGRILRDHRVIEFDGGKVDTDTLELSRPANAYEVRATLYTFSTHRESVDPSPVLKRVDVIASRPMNEASPTTAPAWKAIDLPVPFRAQGVEAESIRHSVCSPTSVSMVLAWAGTDRPTAENCMAIWDDDYAIFGNWNRAVQLAGSLGYDAYLERYSTMDAARATLASGQPIIASIRFKAGEFPSNIQNSTAGHLIVLRGIDANGDIICNDPASRDKGNGVVYKANELAVAWLKNTGGVGYIITKKSLTAK
jgi:hypothetical protein